MSCNAGGSRHCFSLFWIHDCDRIHQHYHKCLSGQSLFSDLIMDSNGTWPAVEGGKIIQPMEVVDVAS